MYVSKVDTGLWCVSCPLVIVCILVHIHFNLVILVLVVTAGQTLDFIIDP